MSKSPFPARALERLRGRLEEGTAVVAGVLSGTSVDGIDVALVRFGALRGGGRVKSPHCLAFHTFPFPEPLGARVRAFIAPLDPMARGPRETALLHRDLGMAFGRAARALADCEGLGLDLVASHGQTVWHHDGLDPQGVMTFQLGDGDHVAAAAAAPAVSDFRTADVAAGGEGAPLSALCDDVLFEKLPRPAAILNLGGIANLTLLGARTNNGQGAALRAFDVGPAGVLLDGLARARLGLPLDRDGRVAASGKADANLVACLLAHPFFDRSPPKTTGRDTFSRQYLDSILEHCSGLSSADVLASAARSVALSILAALDRWGAIGNPAQRPARLVVAGGGMHHRPLVQTLVRGFEGDVLAAEKAGLDGDAREALCFAVLGVRCVRGEPSGAEGVTCVTGAKAGRVLGKISPWM